MCVQYIMYNLISESHYETLEEKEPTLSPPDKWQESFQIDTHLENMTHSILDII